MRRFVLLTCVAGAVALIAYGMIQPVEQDGRWTLALWLAAPLMLAAARLALPALPRGVGRSLQNLGLAIALGFVLLATQLLRQQFVRADAIYSTVHVDEQTGQTTSNVRPVLQSLRIRRGKILDRSGMLLVDTQVVQGGFAVRTYPLADQFDPAGFSNLVGFFSSRFGQAGLEASYGDYLSGDRDSYSRLQDVLLGENQVGDNLQLTIDARLQDAAKRIIGDRTGSIVVLDPTSGAVLAMASAPGFDPRQLAFNPAADRDAENERIGEYWKAINGEGAGQPLLNRPTQGRYPPGSTFKSVTAVGVLEHPDEGKPNDIHCFETLETEPGAPAVVNAVPNLASLTGDPSDLEHVYAYSCNVAFAQYALRLGPDQLAETARQFGIFRPADAPETYDGFTDLSTEPSLLYRDSGFLNRPAALADTGFGQGQLQVTPLQMALVAAAIANDGVIMQPYLVERVSRPDDSTVLAHSQVTLQRAMSRQTAEIMRKNMRAGVAYGFGKAAQQVDPSVALVGGKSGTAEYACPTPDAPNKVCTHAWFIALAPVEKPRFVVAAMIENGGEGSTTGAEAAGAALAAAFEFVK